MAAEADVRCNEWENAREIGQRARHAEYGNLNEGFQMEYGNNFYFQCLGQSKGSNRISQTMTSICSQMCWRSFADYHRTSCSVHTLASPPCARQCRCTSSTLWRYLSIGRECIGRPRGRHRSPYRYSYGPQWTDTKRLRWQPTEQGAQHRI